MTNYDEMWSMLERYSFDIDCQLSAYVTCIICNKLLIDAHLGMCGCKFCKRCVDRLMKDGVKFCPGGTDDCTIQELSWQSNIVKDNGANRMVSKFKVNCPLDMCDYQCELLEMSQHVKVCNKREIMCPFSEMGCATTEMQSDKISRHLLTEIHHHNQLVIEWMTKMRNDVSSLIIDRHQDELINLKQSLNLKMSQLSKSCEDDSKTREAQYEMVKQELLSKNEEFAGWIGQLKEECDRDSREIKQLIEGKNMQNKEIGQMKNTLGKLGREMVQIREGRNSQDQDMPQMKDVRNKLEKEMEQMREGREKLEQEISHLRESKERQNKEIKQLKEAKDKQEKDIKDLAQAKQGHEEEFAVLRSAIDKQDKEMAQMRDARFRQDREITQLKEKLESVISKINETQKRKISQLQTELQTGLERVCVELIDKIENSNKSKVSISALSRSVSTLKRNSSIQSNSTDSSLTKPTQVSQERVKAIASYSWKIGEIYDINDKLQFGSILSSEKFYSFDRQYEMTLTWEWHSPWTCMEIRFNIDPVSLTESADMLQYRATVGIINQTSPSARRIMSQNGKLDRNRKLTFEFQRSDLTNAGVLKHRSILVECVVDSIKVNLQHTLSLG